MATPAKYALYHGCLIPARAPFLERATKLVLADMGIGVEDLKGTSCCVDPITLRSTSEAAWAVLGARNISLAEERGLPLLSQCNGCFSNLNEANVVLQGDAELREAVNEQLATVGRTFKGTVGVHHLVGVLRDAGEERVRSLVKRPLSGWRVASEPGCHLTRPSEYSPFPDARYPRVVEQLASWAGASMVEYSDTIMCCGNVVRAIDAPVADAMLSSLIKAISDAGATHIVTPCPTCFVQLDMGQKDVLAAAGIPRPLPVLFVTEMLALAFGHDPSELGLKYHRVPIDL
jgi:heterodisulfide reductase subunit B2